MAFQGDSIFWVEVEKIVPNPFQPRREFDQQKLVELSESVRMYGILQPLTVTRKEIQREDGTFYTEYELIAGERRLRASKLAGLSQVPVIIREGEDSEQEKLELAIIENLQREDLNAVDRALAFKQLAEVFGLSHTQVAKKVGRSREYVSNSIRLLGLPDYMLNSLRLAEMTEGHARTLLMLNDKPEEQDVVFREILLKKLSVRELERIVRKIATDKVRKKNLAEFDVELIEIEKRFMETLGTRVQIQKTDYGGQLTIDYFSVDDLQLILSRMKDEGHFGNILAPAGVVAAETLTEGTPINVAVDDGGRELSDLSDEVILAEETVSTESVSENNETENTVLEPQLPNQEPEAEVLAVDNAYTSVSPVETEVVVEATAATLVAPVDTPSETPSVPPPAPQAPTPQIYHSMAPAHPPTREVMTNDISNPVSPIPTPQAPTPTSPLNPTAPEVEEYEETVTIPSKDGDDESGLYSIKNFSV